MIKEENERLDVKMIKFREKANARWTANWLKKIALFSAATNLKWGTRRKIHALLSGQGAHASQNQSIYIAVYHFEP